MKTQTLLITFFASLIAHAAIAQDSTTTTQPAAASSPAPAVSATNAQVIIVPAPADSATTAPTAPAPAPSAAAIQPTGTAAQPAAPATQPVAAVAATPAPTIDEPPVPKNEIRMNFQNTALPDVLNYMSSAAGFIIVQQTPVSGTVNIISKQPVTADEAVKLLDSVLAAKGYTVIRDGRILNIVASAGAITNPGMPVIQVSKSADISAVAETVTDILQVKYVDATKLMDNLRPLLAANASMSVNESSNALLITDTKANIKRIAEIVEALDTSISRISTIKVYPLRYADAKDFANVLTQLFSPDTSGTNGQNGGGPGAFFRQFGRGGGGGGGGGAPDDTAAAPQSEARKAATRVVAVADTQSNSVVVSAPAEYIATIDEIVARLDTSTTDVTQTRIFQLEHADSGEVATILNTLYGDSTTLSGSNNRNNQGQNRGGGGRGGNQPNPATQQSSRELQQARMVAVPDPRTNSILVNCSPDTMIEVAQTIGKLDATDAKKQHVHTIALQHADPDSVVGILRTLFGDTQSTTSATSQLQNRQTTGASASVTNTLGTGGSTGSNGRVP